MSKLQLRVSSSNFSASLRLLRNTSKSVSYFSGSRFEDFWGGSSFRKHQDRPSAPAVGLYAQKWSANYCLREGKWYRVFRFFWTSPSDLGLCMRTKMYRYRNFPARERSAEVARWSLVQSKACRVYTSIAVWRIYKSRHNLRQTENGTHWAAHSGGSLNTFRGTLLDCGYLVSRGPAVWTFVPISRSRIRRSAIEKSQ